jgi:Fic family protein
MDFKDYKAGSLKPQGDYKTFSPAAINHIWNWSDPRINVLLEEANTALGELNAFSKIVPNIELFIRMHVVKEATDSSKIEGTKTEFDEAFLDRDSIDPEKQDDWEEVQNYIKAVDFAVLKLKEIPLSLRLLRDTHKVLMTGVRGRNKAPGEFRKVQNWIGGRSPADAKFVPPSPDEVLDLMSDLEAFLHNEEIHVPHLVRIAIAHYQFETIHPFLDGNGRTGRLLITLYLITKGMLDYPTLYLSDYLQRKRQEYFDNLNAARANNDLQYWVIFFLGAVIETAKKGTKVFSSILDLKQEMDSILPEFGKRQISVSLVIEHLFRSPVIVASRGFTIEGIAERTLRGILPLLVESGIIKEVTGRGRDRVYQFDRYLKLFKVEDAE